MNSLLLAYAAPPLLGAFIGYLTNRVAIRMLFRPLRKWRVLKIGIPMTPGVIPGKRHELANNIGEMVGTHLLTSRDIGAALSEERFQEHLYGLIDQRLTELLNRDLGTVYTLIPERFRIYLKMGVRAAKYRFRSGIHNYVRSDDFAKRVTATVLGQLDAIGDRSVDSLMIHEERQAFYGVIDTIIATLISGARTEEWLAGYLQDYIRQADARGQKIGDFLPEPLRELILATLLQRSPEILGQLARLLAEPAVRQRIVRAVRSAVKEFIDSLGPLGAMAAGFLDMDTVEEKVDAYFTNKEEDIRSWLENPEVQHRFSTVLIEQAQKYLDTPLSTILESAGEEKIEQVCRGIAAQLLGILRTEGVVGGLSAMLKENLEDIFDQGRREITAVGEQLLERETIDSLRENITVETVALLRSNRVRELLDRMANMLFDSILNRPLGTLNNYLPQEVRSGISDYGLLAVNRILLREVPSLFESLNIKKMVTDKVDSLDLLKLERLLLSIMEEQFKYINLFGALLGFLIGLFNLLVLHLP